jgi:hypothetical protein
MLTRILFLVSTLALVCGATGCLLEPLTPEEEAALLAEMESSGMETSSLGRGTDPEPSHPGASRADLSDSKGTSLRTMRGSTDATKPDPTPWRSTGRDGKPDPTPWNAQQTEGETDTNTGSGESIWGPSDKPDPTPWKNVL